MGSDSSRFKLVGAVPGRCTITASGNVPKKQLWWHCETCWPNSPKSGACASCAAKCHKGHKLVSKKESKFLCKCPSREEGCEIVLEPSGSNEPPAMSNLPDATASEDDGRKAVMDALNQLNLYELAWSGYDTRVSTLIAEGADVNESYTLGRTALHIAAKRGHTRVVSILLEANADPDTQDLHGRTALLMCLARAHVKVAELLVKKGCNIELADEHGFRAIHSAAFHGCISVVKLLLDKGADGTVADAFGRTALHWAAKSGSADVITLLLLREFDCTVQDIYGKTPLDIAKEGADCVNCNHVYRHNEEWKARCKGVVSLLKSGI